ncbi:2-oxo acid dehydrogenase subunit E2 [Flavobacteriaceae bacterium]|uniref:dihydrolipoamide acetyltransferase family protein n=1 Tax=Candidatus Arcticimaribacter forsetii TaxID=2820661 RepID=UPI002076E52A|nr:dihydrolipoamide acetyltransferase family protein [Candidatus Arcticimaribacter forsetii]MDB2330031.1 2-oxo acid dehydrogenase subunit E2 [Flavobacteriaceae bacterium]MDB2345970.1 2-oxo acid dehydrogenase subunit E2 [Flavobacteriaceae bacterium]MDB2457125.1 2-oxo acid dehydrogenase subunit E2 [Flavobacteriaceae bacterium]MDB4620884.1 2-oxo acid dehydrogenase subunit E2 [Flavobacteriaceae bacterium]MDB4675074.1 2-oxo acid dehydrogenase subunit E2 [Flavobacteriaceae bacterium]
MGKYLLKLPKMGESVAEATLTAWLKDVGDSISIDESIVEVATDKVDSDIPSEVEGVLIEKRFEVNQIAQVGDVIGVIEVAGETEVIEEEEVIESNVSKPEVQEITADVDPVEIIEADISNAQTIINTPIISVSDTSRFYSPLVKNIAKEEGISIDELEQVPGTGDKGRVTKKDILAYIEGRANSGSEIKYIPTQPISQIHSEEPPSIPSGQDQIIQMTRMGKMISDHMVNSRKTSAHVQSFFEVDVTDLWDWRERVKGKFQAREQEKLTFTPIFIAAVVKALKEFPLLNSSVSGDNIIQKKNINIGMATALSDGNLIVPVIKNTDHLNLVGLARAVNDLSVRARDNKLSPDEVQDGTYTVTNVGNFGSITGIPIINQPQVGILAIGVIRKMPAVIETPKGDFIGIRRKMMLCHSYDHRIINGAMGGQFVKAVGDALEHWDTSIDF